MARTRVSRVAGAGSWSPDADCCVVGRTGDHVRQTRVPVNTVDGASVSIESDKRLLMLHVPHVDLVVCNTSRNSTLMDVGSIEKSHRDKDTTFYIVV